MVDGANASPRDNSIMDELIFTQLVSVTSPDVEIQPQVRVGGGQLGLLERLHYTLIEKY